MYHKFGQSQTNRKITVVNIELRLLWDDVYGPKSPRKEKQAVTVNLTDAFFIPQ